MTDSPHVKGRWLALGVLVLGVLLVTVDATVLGLAAPFLAEDLEASGTQLVWIGDIYPLVMAGLLVSMGSLSDRIGRKKLLLIGASLFGLVSLLNAYATSAEMMIAARALLGVAGATLMPLTLGLLRNIFHDPRERSFALGVWGAAASAGNAAGPLVGGLLLEHFWWGSVFLINLPVTAILVIVGTKVLPESRDPNPGPWDLLSVAVSLIGIICVVYAVKEQLVYGYGPHVAAAAVVGAVCLGWFVRRQYTLASPLLDLRLFRARGVLGSVLANGLATMGLAGLLFFLPQFLQLVQMRSPLNAGFMALPAAVGTIITGLLAGRIARRIPVRAAVGAGLTMVGLALTACTFLHAATPTAWLCLALFCAGAGGGLAFTVTADVILTAAPKEQASAAAAVSETSFTLGEALGIALFGSVVTTIYLDFTMPAGIPADAASAARDSLGAAVEAAAHLPHAQAQALLKTAQDAFTHGFETAAALAATVLFATAATIWFMLRGQRLEDDIKNHRD
ncbi:MFS transporter [Streptomyces sp. N35]|uniref:MFS transporter n=1 Tax=Streptomyces sp. N35 TaxID=2795730 RepID=UPI0027DC835D|nr:MFS transporter [Streptomyces sp. N35]